jgi:hypothetical protein
MLIKHPKLNVFSIEKYNDGCLFLGDGEVGGHSLLIFVSNIVGTGAACETRSLGPLTF